jgi:hypothetical protein
VVVVGPQEPVELGQGDGLGYPRRVRAIEEHARVRGRAKAVEAFGIGRGGRDYEAFRGRRRAEAIAALRQVRIDFASRGVPYDAALATLDLAVLLLEDGRAAEVRALAPEMAPIFASLDVHREALAALRLFWRAVEREQVTAELGRHLLRFLERARYDPELRFDASPTHALRTRPARLR